MLDNACCLIAATLSSLTTRSSIELAGSRLQITEFPGLIRTEQSANAEFLGRAPVKRVHLHARSGRGQGGFER